MVFVGPGSYWEQAVEGNANKCDFCDKECVGYTQYQLNLYCEDHEEKAKTFAKKYFEELEDEIRNNPINTDE